MYTAESLYKLYVLFLAASLVIVMCLDWYLMIIGHQTISEWLRDNPNWIIIFVSTVAMYALVLLLHLFLRM